jgi:hypothetical protein
MALTGWSSNYYKFPPDSEEIQDLIEYKNMNFAVGNIFKATYRLGEKEGTTVEYDLEKIQYFAERELSRILRLKEEASFEEIQNHVTGSP